MEQKISKQQFEKIKKQVDKEVKANLKRLEDFKKTPEYQVGMRRMFDKDWMNKNLQETLHSLMELSSPEKTCCLHCARITECGWIKIRESVYPDFKPNVDLICDDCAMLMINFREGKITSEEFYEESHKVFMKSFEIRNKRNKEQLKKLKEENRRKNEHTT